MILSDRTIREELDAGRIVIDPLGTNAIQPSSVDLHVDRYFRVFRNDTTPYIDPKQRHEDLTELVEVKDGGRVHPPSRRVRPRVDARARRAAARPRRPTRGEELVGPPRAAHPLDRGLRRRRMGRASHARAVQRGQPADRALPRHEDRADLVPADDDAGRRARTAAPRPARSTRASAGPTPSRYYLNFVDDD